MRTIAIVGATGVVGREFLNVLEERRFPAERVRLMASARSAGRRLAFAGGECVVEDVETADLSGIDIAFFSAGGAASRRLAPRFVEAGAWVVDNSSAFREDPAIPLVVPEVNGAVLAGPEAQQARIVANPNCSTIILLMALAPLHAEFGVSRVIVSTYQAVSGAGKAALDELLGQVRDDAAGVNPRCEVYDRPIHMNLFPQIGDTRDNGFCQEEWKMVTETRKILGDPAIEVLPTTVRVPVERCHSESVHAVLGRSATAEELAGVWDAAPGVRLVPEGDERRWPTPRELARDPDTWVGRLRPDPWRDDAWLFWVVSDQLLKGAALNAVQIGEMLVEAGQA